jgi:hypothetical protein
MGAAGVFDRLAELSAAVDALAAEFDGSRLDDEHLHAVIREVTRIQDRLSCAAGHVVHEWDQRGSWADNGSRSPAHRLARESARESGRSVPSCRAVLRDAASAAVLPEVDAAVTCGRLAHEVVSVFGRARGAGREALMAEQESELVELCVGHRFGDVVRILRYWTMRADAQLAADGTVPLGSEVAPAEVHVSSTYEGAVAIDGVLDPISGSIVSQELLRLMMQLQRQVDDPAAIPQSQWRARALVEMATRSAAAGDIESRRPVPLFTVLVGADQVAGLCELADNTVIPPASLAPFVRSAMIESVIFDGPARVVGVSSQRTFTGALRRAIEVRDRHCQHLSGCDVPADRCDIDHIVPWSWGGETSQHNGRALCRPHNRHPELRERDVPPVDAGPPPTAEDLAEVRRRWQRNEWRRRRSGCGDEQRLQQWTESARGQLEVQRGGFRLVHLRWSGG